MKYTVMQDYYVTEFDVWLREGDVFQDGDAEPDLVANLVAKGIAEPEGGYPEPKPVKKAAKSEKGADEASLVPTDNE